MSDLLKPKRSHFSTHLILSLLEAKINSSASFRSLSNIFLGLNFHYPLGKSIPSFSTLMLWVKKIGYYQLQLPKEKANDWVIIADESIGIGQEKVLVILGIRRSKINFQRPLKLEDMDPILVKSKESWTGEDIAIELEKAKQKLGTIIYAVTDGGSALKYGLEKTNIKRVYDITHAIAIALEKMYKKDNDFKDFVHKAGQMRFKLCCSKNAHLIPPNQRSKARFQNVDIISKWGIKALNAFKNGGLKQEEKNQLQWIKEKETFIVEMDTLISVIMEISIILKSNGLSIKTKSKCLSILKKCKKGRLKIFKQHIIEYLNENTELISKPGEKLLCCSDIIETTFGRYKNEMSKNQMSGITDLVLIIPALIAKLTTEKVNNAIDNCRVKDIIEWKTSNLCKSLLSKRKEVFLS